MVLPFSSPVGSRLLTVLIVLTAKRNDFSIFLSCTIGCQDQCFSVFLLIVNLIIALPFLRKTQCPCTFKIKNRESSIILICRVQMIFLQQYFLWQGIKGLFLKHTKQRLRVLLLLFFNQFFFFIQAVKVCLIPKSPIIEISEKRRLPRWLSGKVSTCQCKRYKRCGFDPWVGKIPWNRKWQPTPVFLPVKFHGQRSLRGYSP